MPKTVLIVDDNEPTRKLIASIANNAGYQPLESADGETALQIAKERSIDCALIDQYMEPMDGFTLARNIRAAGHDFGMTMITANESSDLLLQAQKHGFVSIMVKPVHPDRLIKMLEHMCR